MSAPKNIKNLNFSVYMNHRDSRDQPNVKTIDSTPPNDNFLEKQMNRIYPKINTEWVDSDKVLKCQICASSFGMFNRKHHCRACGGVFCRTCCGKYMKIPNKLFDIPKQQQQGWGSFLKTVVTKVSGNYDQTNSLVCNDCSVKIKNLNDIEHLIKICDFFSLAELYSVIFTNKKWYNAAIHCLSKFRNIQYKSPGHIFDRYDCDMIMGNKESLLGHTSWINILVKAYIIKNENVLDLVHLLNRKTKTTNCWSLMCSRKCNIDIDMLNVIDILKFISLTPIQNQIWKDDHIIQLIKCVLNKINPIHTNYCLLPFISSSLGNNFSDKNIYNILDLFVKNPNFLILLSFEYNYLKNKIIKEPIENYLNLFIKDRIEPDLKILIYKTTNLFTKMYTERTKFVDSENLLPIIYPFDTTYVITKILEIVELQSSSKPILVKLLVKKVNSRSAEIEKRIILKSDKNLRKENIVSCLIILLQNKLIQQMQRGRIEPFDPIPTYKIIMLTNELGIIEFLDDCFTLKSISVKNYTLQNFILDHNKDDKISTIKERFAKSLAISSCLSFILGLGDRHSSNIMLSKKGQIIHIDYGYILENPIHSTILNHPVIRISNEMIDFLGGVNGDYYQLFKQYIINVFDIMRLYSDIIINYYSILGKENIINWAVFKEKLIDRFMNGMSIKDVQVVLIDVIETSSQGYSGSLIDMCNEYNSTLKSYFSY
jgi:hypothetical protein